MKETSSKETSVQKLLDVKKTVGELWDAGQQKAAYDKINDYSQDFLLGFENDMGAYDYFTKDDVLQALSKLLGEIRLGEENDDMADAMEDGESYDYQYDIDEVQGKIEDIKNQDAYIFSSSVDDNYDPVSKDGFMLAVDRFIDGVKA